MHVRLAYRDDKLLGAAIMDVIVQLQLNPPQILAFTDPELEARQPQQQHPPPVPQPIVQHHQPPPPPPPPEPQQIVQHHQPPPPSSLRSVHTAPSTDTGPSSPGASFVMAPATVTPPSQGLRDPPAKAQAPTVMPIRTNQHRPAVLVTHNTVHSAAQSSFLAPSTYDPHHYDPHHDDPQQQQDVIMVQAEPVRTRDGRMMMMMAHHDDDDDGCGG
jgi:hypothetical protein